MFNRLKNRWFVFAILLCGLPFLNCNNSAHNKAYVPATITGLYNRICFSGPGIVLTFNGEKNTDKGLFYVADNLPEEFGINSEAAFPIEVNVDTANLSQSCAHPLVHLNKVVKR